MALSVRAATLPQLAALREDYGAEMNCQIIHDSIHSREGWTLEYVIDDAGELIGYGSVAVGGPWSETPTLYEYYVTVPYRVRLFECFDALMDVARPRAIETQTNAPLLAVLLHVYCENIRVESVLFQDAMTTRHQIAGSQVRKAIDADGEALEHAGLDRSSSWLMEVNGTPVAAGGVLYHYNRPYGDIYMEVAEPCRRQGYGAFLVQELKAACRAEGTIPAARCNVNNVASQKTLQNAGFVPCGCIVNGSV